MVGTYTPAKSNSQEVYEELGQEINNPFITKTKHNWRSETNDDAIEYIINIYPLKDHPV